jgi:hypothetical protein
MTDYYPMRLIDKPFYIEYSSCYLECTDKKIKTRFQVATGSQLTSLCSETLKLLKIPIQEDLSIYIDDSIFIIPITTNKLEGNILGMDILSKCYLSFDKGLKITSSS